MKRFVYYLLSVFAVLGLCISCSNSKIEKEAKESSINYVKCTYREYLNIMTDDSIDSLNISNVVAIYTNDSLCIIRLDVSQVGNESIYKDTIKFEYVFLLDKGNKYEAMHLLDSDSVYLSNENYENRKKGQFYENMDYDKGIRYLATIFVNNYGRSVDDSTFARVNINTESKTGNWILKRDKIAKSDTIELKSYVRLEKNTGINYIPVSLFLTKDLYTEQLIIGIKFETNWLGTLRMHIKNIQKNFVEYFVTYNKNREDYLFFMLDGVDYKQKIIKILQPSGMLLFSTYSFFEDNMKFSMDASGLEEAVKYLDR